VSNAASSSILQLMSLKTTYCYQVVDSFIRSAMVKGEMQVGALPAGMARSLGSLGRRRRYLNMVFRADGFEVSDPVLLAT